MESLQRDLPPLVNLWSRKLLYFDNRTSNRERILDFYPTIGGKSPIMWRTVLHLAATTTNMAATPPSATKLPSAMDTLTSKRQATSPADKEENHKRHASSVRLQPICLESDTDQSESEDYDQDHTTPDQLGEEISSVIPPTNSQTIGNDSAAFATLNSKVGKILGRLEFIW